MNKLRRRTYLSFAVLILGAVVLCLLWLGLSRLPKGAQIPPAFRQALELNGRLWQKMFRPQAKSACHAKPKSNKAPRVNGDIGMLPSIDLEKWRLEVVIDASRRLSLSREDLIRLPRTDSESEFYCIEGWSEDISYAGIKFSDFLKAYGLEAKEYVGLVSVNGEYYVSIDRASMLHEQTVLAFEMNGQPLSMANGAPLRLIIPVKYGIKHIKQIGKIFFSDQRPPDYWAEQGYDWYSGL